MQTILLMVLIMGVCVISGYLFGMVVERTWLKKERTYAGTLVITEDYDGLHIMAALSMDPEEIALNDEVYFAVSKPHKPSYGNIVSFKGKENGYE